MKKSGCAAAAAQASRRAEVEFHAQAVRRAKVSRVQFRRGRAGHVQGPRHPALQPAHGDRRHAHRRLRRGQRHRLQLHPRRNLGRIRALRGGAGRSARRRLSGQEHPRHRFLVRAFTPFMARAPTSAARRPACSSRSRARKASRASSRRSRRATACTASRPPSTTPRRFAAVPWIINNGGDALPRPGQAQQRRHQAILRFRAM